MKNIQAAIDHLQKDEVLGKLISQFGVINYEPPTDIFESLAQSIVGQQLSGKAADTIWGRFVTLFPNKKVTPHAIMSLEIESMRNIGTSWAKARSLKDLAEKTVDGTVQINKLETMSDEDMIEHLIKVKGIGRWTAQMRLMFSFERSDILPLDDIGIQNAFVKLYGLNRSHKTLHQKMTKIAAPWRPYRTIACWYLWRFLDNRPA